MIKIIITSFFVITIMIAVMFILLKNVVKSIDEQTKSYFVLKLQDYDYLVEEKSRKLKEIESFSSNEKDFNNIDDSNNFKNRNEAYSQPNFNNANYQIDNVLESLKEIDEKFVINGEKIVRMFIDMATFENKNFQIFEAMRNKINNYGLFELFSMNDLDVIQKLKDLFIEEEKNVFNSYLINNDKFIFDSFLQYLDYNILINDPVLYVEVGDEKENYDYLSNKVKTVYNEKIYKGIIIRYKNRIYDYSLN